MSKLTYEKLIAQVLKEAKAPLGASEIWQIACQNGLDKDLQSIGKTPKNTIRSIIYADKNKIIQTSKSPTKFWLKSRENELNDLTETTEQENFKRQRAKFHERDLHPLLVKFLNKSADFKLECKTIYHEKSKKSTSGKDKWSYPDIVGAYFPNDDYELETLNLFSNTKKNNCKIFSFELKISLDFSNLKESYFQAVSNSSWANESYLVIFNEVDDEVLTELRRLNQSFGIGLIKLESDDLLSSKILLSAKERA